MKPQRERPGRWVSGPGRAGREGGGDDRGRGRDHGSLSRERRRGEGEEGKQLDNPWHVVCGAGSVAPPLLTWPRRAPPAAPSPCRESSLPCIRVKNIRRPLPRPSMGNGHCTGNKRPICLSHPSFVVFLAVLGRGIAGWEEDGRHIQGHGTWHPTSPWRSPAQKPRRGEQRHPAQPLPWPQAHPTAAVGRVSVISSQALRYAHHRLTCWHQWGFTGFCL